tara:strand:+ start:78 stop:191 length:114 start_codon:yes stop_codon:yes gene_type:complete
VVLLPALLVLGSRLVLGNSLLDLTASRLGVTAHLLYR